MTTEELIVQLARRAGTVVALPSRRREFAHWTTWTALWAVTCVSWFGPRADLGARMTDAAFLTRSGLVLIAAVVAVLHALRWGVPGAEPGRWRRWEALLLLAGWAAVVAAPLLGTAIVPAILSVRSHPSCAFEVMAVASLPSAWLAVWLSRAAPYELAWAGSAAAIAGASVGMFAVQLVCSNDTAPHGIVWHVLPVVGLVVIGTLVTQRALPRH